MWVCVTKSLIGQGLRMEESVIQFYRMHTPLYTQSASYCSIEDHMHVMVELHAAYRLHAVCHNKGC
jgi:hypothetical protein